MSPARRNEMALVTGASRGIGMALARSLAKRGFSLVLVARSSKELEDLASELRRDGAPRIEVVAIDIGKLGSPQELHERLTRDGIEIDWLVNNAGFGGYGRFVDSDLEHERDMIQVNIAALTELTKWFARDMVKRGHGLIMNVASTGSFQPGPLMAVYYASKAYVLSFTEALANELSGTGVSACALCPGPVMTGFQKRAGMTNSRILKSMMVMTAAEVAEVGVRGAMAGRRVIIPGWLNWLVAQSVRFAPRRMVTAVARWVMEQG